MDSCDRSEMAYGIDFGTYHPQQLPDYSQPSLPHLQHKYPSQPTFPPQGMDSELYNLLINASEKEFPIELGGISQPQPKLSQPRNPNNSLEKIQEIVSQADPAKNRANPRKRRLPTTTSAPAVNPQQQQQQSNPNLQSSTNSNQNNINSSQPQVPPSVLEDDSNDEKDEVNESQAKRNRRLVKNREAAQLFRQRQKAYIGHLEQKVDKPSTENVTLQSKVDLLSAENKLIKEQLGYLRNFISQVTMTLPFPYNQQTQIPREPAFARKAGFDPKYQ